jgi:hypothetical protein
MIGFVIFAIWRAGRTKRWLLSFGWIILACAVAGGFAGAGIGAVVVAAAFGTASVVARAVVGAGAVAGAVIVAVTMGGVSAIGGDVGAALAFAYMVAYINILLVNFLSKRSIERDKQGFFLSLFVPMMFVVCFAAASRPPRLQVWDMSGPLLLFLGLLTLINAPFDWLSLGLTRALMRRGLEREKWWPYLYAVVDALLTSVIIAFLAMAMVAGIRLFDYLAVYGGGKSVLPPMREYLDAIQADPIRPEYWWIYATLFSTMLPSLINLLIAGVSLARGVPGVSSWLLGKVNETEAVPAYDRLLVAVVLALQGVAGAVMAVAAQGFLFWVIIYQGMPRLGIGALDLAHLVAH